MVAGASSGGVCFALALALALAPGGTGCDSSGATPELILNPLPATAASSAHSSTHLVEPHSEASARCLRQIAQVKSEPSLEGAPVFESRRHEIFARAKGAPVFLLRAPEPPSETTDRVRRFRRLLSGPKATAVELYGAYRTIVRSPAFAREVLLTEGYLFSDKPNIAFALSYVARLEDLFVEDVIWLQRGAERFELRKTRGARGHFYEHTGVRAGTRAVLLFLDRVALDAEALGTPLHRDARQLLEQLSASGISVRRFNADRASVTLRYGELRVPALVRSEGASWQLVCEAPTRLQSPGVKTFKVAQQRRHRRMGLLKAAIDAQVAEQLPFDEPRTELGQQDGKLREAWREAYSRGRRRYQFNNDSYRVFDAQGRPLVPQVCVDFVVDTFERAAGTWWQSKSQPRVKSRGSFELDNADIGSRRRVQDFIEFARDKSMWFDVHELEANERVPLSRRKRFFDQLFKMSEQFQPGDVVIIYGPRDDAQLHYHSFFVYSSDPFSGMPIVLASNAVKPQLRSWEAEMLNAPRRTIRTRIRPRQDWLGQILE